MTQETSFFISEWPNITAVPHLREKCNFQRKAGLKDPSYGGMAKLGRDRFEEGNPLV